jgi:hypothetical protein
LIGDQDPRDEELAARLDALAPTHPGNEMTDRLAEVRRRGTAIRVIRWTAIGVALALFLSAVGVGAFALRSHPATPAGPGGWATDRDLGLGVTLDYPRRWHLQNYGEGAASSGCGVLVSNVDHRFRHPHIAGGYTSAWDMRGLPKDLVVIDLHCREGYGPAIQVPPTTFPISMTDMRSDRFPQQYSYGEPEPFLFLPVSSGSWTSRNLFVYLGSQATASDRQIAEQIVGSIRLLAALTPSAVGSHGPCATSPATGLPTVVATPARGPVGSRVHLQGCGFTASYWQELNREQPPKQYGVSLLSANQIPGCELIATVQQGTAHVSAAGVLTADIVIPSTGSCFQAQPDSLRHAVTPGTYTIVVVCHACDVGTFEVTTP